MGIRTVAVFSEADRTARHVMYADEACPVSYTHLVIDAYSQHSLKEIISQENTHLFYRAVCELLQQFLYCIGVRCV